jgi:hypothetical protein
MLTKAIVKFKKAVSDIKLTPRTGYLIATRPESEHKCRKVLMRIPIGGVIPPGTTLGKGTIINLEV